jgi:hypothetical protein
LIDWNSDGQVDTVSDYTVFLNSGRGNPYRFQETVQVLPAGAFIEHPSGIGDDHFWPYLADVDDDGRIDVLFGDWHGHVWFHRNLSTPQKKQFDITGVRLATEDGKPIKVGPINGDIEKDFVALQGARTTLTAGDYDNDGLDDLIVGDTYGIIRYYKNLGPAELPRFAPAVKIGDLKTRLTVERTDWNGDGKLDVAAGAANHRVFVFLNTGDHGRAAFDEGRQLQLPHIKGPSIHVADLNRDGDDDLFISGTQGTTFVERSFLRHGYAKARVLAIQKRPSR